MSRARASTRCLAKDFGPGMTNLATDTQTPQRRIARPLWFAAGSLSLLLGMIGVVLPVLPTTCFVLFAAFAYSKSSPRMARYLETHRVFGPIIADWRAHGAIAPRFKAMAVATMGAVRDPATGTFFKLTLRRDRIHQVGLSEARLGVENAT